MTSEAVGIRLDGVSKRFRGGVTAVQEVTLDVQPGEFLVLVGPSGCGKSTILRMIAGLEEVTEGRIFIGEKDVTNQLPQQRDVAMVFQSYALYPRMSVRRNLGFGLRMRRTNRAERERRVAEVAHSLGLDPLLDRRPAALSGGQRQRVAMGRAIVREPKAFLMDEPLSNLDAKLRVSMRAQLTTLHQRLGTTTVYVTHDQVEAMTLGQRVAVLRDGVLQQCDTPQRVFHQPANLFVAAFIGSPSMNFVEAEVAGAQARFAGFTIPLPDAPADGRVVLGIRPTGFSLASDRAIDRAAEATTDHAVDRAAEAATGGAADGPATEPANGRPAITVRPRLVEDLGDERYVIFDLEAPRVDTDATRAAVEAQTVEDALLLPENRAQFTARLPADAPVTVGEPLTLAIDPGRVHLFDPQTGRAR